MKERKYGIGLVELQLPTHYDRPVLFLTRSESRGESVAEAGSLLRKRLSHGLLT